jgi:excisionase family DNA binding protein
MPTLAESPNNLLVADGFAEIVEAQEYLKLSRATLYNMMESGELPYAKFGRRRRIPWRALWQYAAGNLVTR